MESIALSCEVLVPLGIGAAVARYIAVVAHPLLREICGTEVRAAFWMRLTTVSVLLIPPAMTLGFAGSGSDGNLDRLLHRTLLLSLLGTLLAVGVVARVLFRSIPDVAKGPVP